MRVALVLGALLVTGCALGDGPSGPAPQVPRPASHDADPKGAGPRLPAQEIPLAFDRAPFHLEGTLSLPERGEGEKLPGVVIVHGSGPMSRDGAMRGQIGLGFGFEMPVYKLLADALTARGYAVYRYDKRSCNAWNGCKEDGSDKLPYGIAVTELATGQIVADAEAALDALAARPEIDPDRLAYIGHSEGGELVPLLLSERPRARAGVMLAPPFHSMAVVLQQQSERLRWAFAAAGEPDRAEIEGGALHDAALALRRIEDGTHLGGPVLGQPAGIWASWIDLAQKIPAIARDLDRPLLVLGGGYDYNVAPSEVETWQTWLAASPHASHRVRILPCVTHALNCIAQRDPSRITPTDIGHGVAPDLIDEVTRFLDANARAPKPPAAGPSAPLSRR